MLRRQRSGDTESAHRAAVRRANAPDRAAAARLGTNRSIACFVVRNLIVRSWRRVLGHCDERFCVFAGDPHSLSYLFLYTPLKRITPLCTLVGAFPGAAPPLIGWAAACGHLDAAAWVLFAIVFLWQFPHFMSIAWMYREDYARAGYLVLPAGELKDRFVAWQSRAARPGPFRSGHSFLRFAVSQESSTLQALSFLEAPFSTTAHASLFKGPSPARGSCFLLPSSISRCCLHCSPWTRNKVKRDLLI